MAIINKAAILNPFDALTANITDYIPKATTSEFGIVAIGSGINVDALGRIYLDTQEYSDRLTAIEAQASSSLATQQTEVAAAIAQVNLTQSQSITALTLEVSNLKTSLTDSFTTITNSITATQTDLINRADQLAQDVTDITVQLTQDKAAFTQEIQDALVYLQNEASTASALRTPRKINGTNFDGSSDITTDTWGATRTFKIGNKTNSINGTSNVDYSLADIGAFPDVGGTIQGDVEVTGNLSVGGLISATLEGNAETATKLQTPRTINGVLFDGTQNISLPEAVAYSLPTASDSVLGGIKVGSGLAIADSVLSVGTLNQSTTGNAATATVLQDARTINGTSFNGSADITTANWGTTRTLTIGSTGKSVDGSADVSWTLDEMLPTASNGQVLKYNGTSWVPSTNSNTPYTAMTAEEANTGTATEERVITAAVLKGAIQTYAPVQTPVSGNAETATKLQTARAIAISGAVTGTATSFDGSADIAIATTAIDGSKISTGIIPTERIPTLNQSTTGNAGSATKLATARTIALTGAVTGSVNFDGTDNVNIDTTIAGALGIANGGTGGTSAAEARTNLDVYSKDEVNTAITTSVPIVADATTIDKGIVRLATESDITNLSETSVVTPKNVADMLVGVRSGFRALLSARVTQLTGTNSSNGNTITCAITGHGLSVGDVVRVEYRYRSTGAIAVLSTDTVVVTSVADVNTFTFTTPRVDATGSIVNQTCKLLYVIKNNYNVDSLTILGTGRYAISINTNSGITGANFIPFAQVTTSDNTFAIALPEAITSATSLTVRTFNAAGSLIIPQWLHIGVTQ